MPAACGVGAPWLVAEEVDVAAEVAAAGCGAVVAVVVVVAGVGGV